MAATESVSRPVLLHRRPDDTRRRPSHRYLCFCYKLRLSFLTLSGSQGSPRTPLPPVSASRQPTWRYDDSNDDRDREKDEAACIRYTISPWADSSSHSELMNQCSGRRPPSYVLTQSEAPASMHPTKTARVHHPGPAQHWSRLDGTPPPFPPWMPTITSSPVL